MSIRIFSKYDRFTASGFLGIRMLFVARKENKRPRSGHLFSPERSRNRNRSREATGLRSKRFLWVPEEIAFLYDKKSLILSNQAHECWQWDLNPYVVTHNRFWVCLVCHSDTPAFTGLPATDVILTQKIEIGKSNLLFFYLQSIWIVIWFPVTHISA